MKLGISLNWLILVFNLIPFILSVFKLLNVNKLDLVVSLLNQFLIVSAIAFYVFIGKSFMSSYILLILSIPTSDNFQLSGVV